MNQNIKIGIIIINYNSAKYLLKSLNALSQQTYLPYEVIVFDNASSEALPEAVSSFNLNLKIVKSDKNIGFAAGNNRAIESLNDSVNWIGLLNPDAYPAPNWLEEMVYAIKNNPSYAFFGSQLICETEPTLLDGTGDAYHISGKAWRINHKKSLDYAPKNPHEIFSPCAAAALYRRGILEAVQGFDETFFCYYEDIDLAFRLRLLGYQCCYVPNAIAFHTGSATTTRHSDFYTYHGHRNMVWTYFKNMPSLLLILFLPLHLLLNIVSVFVIGSRGQWSTVLKAKKDAIKEFKTIYQHRKKWRSKQSASNKAIFKVLKKGLPW